MRARTCRNSGNRRRAVVAVQVAVLMTVLLSVAALTIDVGAMFNTRAELQRTADAASLAGAIAYLAVEDKEVAGGIANEVARNIAAANPMFGMRTAFTLHPSDVQLGRFIVDSDLFLPGASRPDAVRVVARRSEQTNGPLDLFFAAVFGKHTVDLQAEAVAMFGDASQVSRTVPIALRTPEFGPVDPVISQANPGKDGPSGPADGNAFQIGEQVTLFIFGRGKKSPVHLILNTNEIPGEAEIGKVMNGELPGIPLSIGEELPVLGEGTGHNGLGGKLADRLDDGDPSNDTIGVPIVEAVADWHGTFSDEETVTHRSRNDEGELDGHVRVVDFVAIRLDGVVEVSVPDPNDPQDSGKTIAIELLVGTITQTSVSGTAGQGSSVVNGVSAAVVQLVR